MKNSVSHNLPASNANASDQQKLFGLPSGTQTWGLVEKILETDYSIKDKLALLRELRKMSPRHNRMLYMTVVVILGLVVVSTVIWGFSLLTFPETPIDQIPASLVALGSTALGALAGLLAPSPRDDK